MDWEKLNKLNTPCFIFDEEGLIANFNDFNTALKMHGIRTHV